MEERAPWWLWMNLLSLDAPLVAVVWQDFLAHCHPSVLRPAGRWILGLTVWGIYLTDRLLDARHPVSRNEAPRHGFYRRNRRPAKILLAAVVLSDVLIALRWLRPAVLSNGLWAGAAVAGYLLLFALWRAGMARWKQPFAAVLFTTGIFLVAWTGTAAPWHSLAAPAAAFCALCWGNLVFVETWEQDRSTPRGWLWMSLLALLCLTAGGSAWYSAIALSAAGLAALDFRSTKLSGNARHVLADAVLLTPLFFRSFLSQ